MRFSNLPYLLVLLISINQEFVASSNYKNNSFTKILLVQNDNNVRTIIVSGKGESEEEAAMNAAQNALLMASPRYIKKKSKSL